MPVEPTTAQSDASRQNGALSTGPATEAGKARSSLNATRHGLSGRTFFLLADEDEADWLHHTALELAMLQPRDALERAAALAVARATWREVRADRLEAQVLGDLFAAGRLADPAEAAAAKAVAFKALGTLLRYRGRIEREQRQAMQALDALRLRHVAPQACAGAERTRACPGAAYRRHRRRQATHVASCTTERTRAVTPVEPPPAPRPAGDRAPAAQARRLGTAPRRQRRSSAGGCPREASRPTSARPLTRSTTAAGPRWPWRSPAARTRPSPRPAPRPRPRSPAVRSPP